MSNWQWGYNGMWGYPAGVPYTDFHRLNLDWVLNALQTFNSELKQIPDYIVEQLQNALDQTEFDKIIADYLTSVGVLNVKTPPDGLTAMVGDGATDDSAAWQSILNYAASNDSCIFIPHGSYIINNFSVPTGIGIYGECMLGTKLFQKGGQTGLFCTLVGENGIRNLTLDCVKYNKTVEVDAIKATHSHVQNVAVLNAYTGAEFLDNCFVTDLHCADNNADVILSGTNNIVTTDGIVTDNGIDNTWVDNEKLNISKNIININPQNPVIYGGAVTENEKEKYVYIPVIINGEQHLIAVNEKMFVGFIDNEKNAVAGSVANINFENDPGEISASGIASLYTGKTKSNLNIGYHSQDDVNIGANCPDSALSIYQKTSQNIADGCGLWIANIGDVTGSNVFGGNIIAGVQGDAANSKVVCLELDYECENNVVPEEGNNLILNAFNNNYVGSFILIGGVNNGSFGDGITFNNGIRNSAIAGGSALVCQNFIDTSNSTIQNLAINLGAAQFIGWTSSGSLSDYIRGTASDLELKGKNGILFSTDAQQNVLFVSGQNIGVNTPFSNDSLGAYAGYINLNVNGTNYKLPLYN